MFKRGFIRFACTLLLIFICKSSFGQNQRAIVVTGPELIDTSVYEYSIWVRRYNQYNRIWAYGPAHFELHESNQKLIIPIPVDVHDSIFELDLTIDKKTNWRYYSEYQPQKVQMTSDTVYVDINEAKMKEVKRHFRKEHLRLAFDWDLFNSKVLTVSYYQGHQPYGEVMFSFSQIESYGSFPLVMYGPSLGTEFNFEWNEDFILGPKIGFYFSTFLINAGVFGVAYTDFDKTSWYLKPRIGINTLTPIVNLSYEYGIRLSKNHFGTRINQHQLSVNINIPLHID